MATDVTYTMYCPRCDRPFTDPGSPKEALEKVKKHVRDNHPDHDPEWFDTHPEALGT